MSRMATGMLKIVASESEPGRTILRLEGQVIGPWVEELKIASETALIHSAVVLDLGDVSFVERRGVELLQASAPSSKCSSRTICRRSRRTGTARATGRSCSRTVVRSARRGAALQGRAGDDPP